MHPDVLKVLAQCQQLGHDCAGPTPEPDNVEYGAAIATVGGATVRFRVGKLTPAKAGLFVAIWRRASDGTTEPFPADSVDALIVSAREAEKFGVFVFPRAALAEHGIGSIEGNGGKRGFRLYPSWSPTTSRQAIRTQRWQGDYFWDEGQGIERLGRLLWAGE